MQILVALVRLPLTCLIITINVGLIRCSVSAWNCTVHNVLITPLSAAHLIHTYLSALQ